MKKTTFLKYLSVMCFVIISSNLCLAYTGNALKANLNSNELFGDPLPYGLPLTADFTVIAKIKININNSTLFSWSNEDGDVFSSITITEDYKLRFSIPAIGYSIDSDVSLESGCYHVAVVCDRGKITLFVNGEEEISTQIDLGELASLIGTVDINSIKGNLATSGGFDISEFAIFDNPLAKLVIQQLILSPPVITTNVDIGLLLALNFNISGMPFEGLSGNFKAEICSTLNSESKVEKTLKIFPNPASNYIKLTSSFINSSYRISDVLGKEILAGKVTQSTKIDVTSLKNGLYFLKIDTKYSVKFIKD